MRRTLVLVAMMSLGAKAALALPPISNTPPPFRIYDVDRRQREMRHLISQLAGTPSLSQGQAEAALGRLNAIGRRERASRAHHGGRLDLATIRAVDAALNAMSRRLGVRAPRQIACSLSTGPRLTSPVLGKAMCGRSPDASTPLYHRS